MLGWIICLLFGHEWYVPCWYATADKQLCRRCNAVKITHKGRYAWFGCD